MKGFIAVAANLLPVSGAAQTVDDVVTRYLAARGDAARIEAVQSLRMTGRAQASEGARRSSCARSSARAASAPSSRSRA